MSAEAGGRLRPAVEIGVTGLTIQARIKHCLTDLSAVVKARAGTQATACAGQEASRTQGAPDYTSSYAYTPTMLAEVKTQSRHSTTVTAHVEAHSVRNAKESVHNQEFKKRKRASDCQRSTTSHMLVVNCQSIEGLAY